jgi:hypothetical protein
LAEVEAVVDPLWVVVVLPWDVEDLQWVDHGIKDVEVKN